MIEEKMQNYVSVIGSYILTSTTIFLYAVTRMNITDWAGVATILAALSTMALNYFRYRKLKKRKNERNSE